MPLKREHLAEFYTELDAGEAAVTVTVSGQAKLQRDIARRRGRETSRSFFAGGGAGNRDPDPKDESSESNEELQAVIAEAMHTEYKMTELQDDLIQDDLIQDDCRRRLAVAARRRAQPPLPSATSKTFGAGCRDIVKHAIEDLPADRVRYHVCWGSWLAGVEDRQARTRADADPGRHQP
jgi:hypothetical protein